MRAIGVSGLLLAILALAALEIWVEYIIRDGDGRDTFDEVVLERGHCWKCKRVTHQGAPLGEFMFGCPTPEDFVAPYTIELIEGMANRMSYPCARCNRFGAPQPRALCPTCVAQRHEWAADARRSGGPVPHEPARDWWSRWVVAAVAASAALVTVASAILRRGPPEVAAGAKRAEFKLQPGAEPRSTR